MKKIAVFILVLFGSLLWVDCSRIDSNTPLVEFDIDSWPLQKLVPVESSYLDRYILANDVITKWPAVERLNAQLKIKQSKDKYLAEIRELYQFYKISTSNCNGFRHELIVRRMHSEADKIPDQTLLLLSIDKQGNLLSTVTLAAKSSKQLITRLDQETTSILHRNSTLTTVEYSNFCSDVLDENGKMHCTRVEIKNRYKISCDKSFFLSSDTLETRY